MKAQQKIKRRSILLPKNYLSWSSLSTFLRSEEEYIRHYFYGEPNEFTNPAMEFGSEFAAFLETGEKHPDPVVDMALRAIPKMPLREHSIEAVLPSRWGDIPLLGKLDAYDPITHAFSEYKTGKRKWTVAMANKHGQMKFYSLILYLKYGVINAPKNLIWIETEHTEFGVKPTGRIEVYPVKVTLVDILQFGTDVAKAAIEISELYKQTINQI